WLTTIFIIALSTIQDARWKFEFWSRPQLSSCRSKTKQPPHRTINGPVSRGPPSAMLPPSLATILLLRQPRRSTSSLRQDQIAICSQVKAVLLWSCHTPAIRPTRGTTPNIPVITLTEAFLQVSAANTLIPRTLGTRQNARTP